MKRPDYYAAIIRSFSALYIFALLGLVLKLISDITYSLVDPRINFEKIQ